MWHERRARAEGELRDRADRCCPRRRPRRARYAAGRVEALGPEAGSGGGGVDAEAGREPEAALGEPMTLVTRKLVPLREEHSSGLRAGAGRCADGGGALPCAPLPHARARAARRGARRRRPRPRGRGRSTPTPSARSASNASADRRSAAIPTSSSPRASAALPSGDRRRPAAPAGPRRPRAPARELDEPPRPRPTPLSSPRRARSARRASSPSSRKTARARELRARVVGAAEAKERPGGPGGAWETRVARAGGTDDPKVVLRARRPRVRRG